MLQTLPPLLGQVLVIRKQQKVYDIVTEVLDAHEIYAVKYDLIAPEWMIGNFAKIPRRLFYWCKDNLKYKVEGEDWQSTRSPAGILSLDTVDCKHFAGFCSGILDAINRTGEYYYDWAYRFASYDWEVEKPQHVFVVLYHRDGSETWIDPVPEVAYFNSHHPSPVYWWDKRLA